MSHETDRVQVPTNGRGPHPPAAAEPAAPAPADPAPADAPGVTEPTPAFTPTQLAIGFGIVASLILLLAGRRRRGRRS
jgi:hypothetical protein